MRYRPYPFSPLAHCAPSASLCPLPTQTIGEKRRRNQRAAAVGIRFPCVAAGRQTKRCSAWAVLFFRPLRVARRQHSTPSMPVNPGKLVGIVFAKLKVVSTKEAVMKRSISLVAVLALSGVSGLALAAGEEKMPQTGSPSGYEAEAGSSGSAGSSSSSSESAGSSSSSSSSAMPSFSQADSDSNGAIDQTEAGSITGLDMSSADSNGDGKLSRTEYEAATLRQGSGSSGSSSDPSGTSSGSRSRGDSSGR